MAPEVIEQKGNISPKCDIWSLGCTIIQLLTTKPPYYEFEPMAAMFRIVTDDCPPIPNGISNFLKDFLLKCFIKEPSKRPNAKELLLHPWITTPNKKLVKKFINENNNSSIPVNLINEWKNNYRNILASGNSSQNNRTVSQNITEDLTLKANSIINDSNYNFFSKNNGVNINQKKLFKNNEEEKTLMSKKKLKKNDINEKNLKLNNDNEKYFAKDIEEKNELEKEIKILLDSFQLDEDNFLNKKRSLEESINLEDNKMNNKEELFSDNIDNITDIIQNLIILEKNNSNDESINNEKIYYNNKSIDKKEYFFMIIKNIGKFLVEKNDIKEFINTFEISQFVNLFSSKYMTSKSLLLLMKYLNMILSEKPECIKDILINQIIFHLSRYIYIFQDIKIKLQISVFIHYCLISKSTIELFLSSGGIFLLNSFLNSDFLKKNETIIIISLDYLLYILFQFGNDVSLQFINNKILTRLNLLLIDLQNFQNEEDNLENEKNKNILIYEKIFYILTRITTNINKDYLYLICNDKLIITLSKILNNLDLSRTKNILQIFDNLMTNSNNLNILESMGYIHILLKLLNKLIYSDISNNQSSLKIINKVLNQINQIIKLSKSRSEIFVLAEGVDIICSLADVIQGNECIYQIIYILSELINATNFTRKKLRKSKALELIVKLLMEKKDFKVIKELTQIILNWIGEEKDFIEKYITREDKFHNLFQNICNVLNNNENDFIQILNEFFRLSEYVTNKFFKDNQLIEDIMKMIENSLNNKDIHFMNKVMDFYLILIKYKKNDIAFLNKINFKRNMEKIKAVSKEKHLIIIEEKLKKIETYVSKENL
jgi:serine/threonine protein kinase